MIKIISMLKQKLKSYFLKKISTDEKKDSSTIKKEESGITIIINNYN